MWHVQETALRQREQRPKLQGLAPLQAYLADLMSFNIACLKTWVARRAGTSNAGGQPQHVPCVRHLLDARACNILLLLYMLTATATVSTRDAGRDTAWQGAVLDRMPAVLLNAH